MPSSTLSWVVYLADFVCTIGLLAVLFLRGRVKDFPALTICYSSWFLAAIINFAFGFNWPDWAFVCRDAITEGAALVACFGVARHIFRPTGVWARDVRRTFFMAAAGCVLLAMALTCLDHPRSANWFGNLLLRTYFFTNLLITEVFVVTVMLSATVGLPWKTHVARVAQGLGANCFFYLALNTLSNSIDIWAHVPLWRALARTGLAVKAVTEAYMAVMLWRDAPQPRELPAQMRAQIFRLNHQLEAELIRFRGFRPNE